MFTRKYYTMTDTGTITERIVVPNEMQLETIEEELEECENFLCWAEKYWRYEDVH